MNTWIVNDTLTCIPGTKTFWHMLLSIEGTVDKTGYSFGYLPVSIEDADGECELVIRNGTFFRWIERDCKTISFIQDYYANDENQIDCLTKSDCVVFNSKWTRDKYSEQSFTPLREHRVIPIGVNQDLFRPNGYHSIFDKKKKVGIFVGDYNTTKNTRMFESICGRRPDLDFIYVSKAGNSISHSNVRNIRGGVDERGMVELYNSADFCIMCSPVETLHLTTVEAALCDIPVIGTNTGWLSSHYSDTVGERIDDCNNIDLYLSAIEKVLKGTYSPREFILNYTPYTWSACKKEWEEVINEVLSK